MTKHLFPFGPDKSQQITSLVMDEHEFSELINQLDGVFMINGSTRAGKLELAAILKAGHLPLASRGTKTESLFARYAIDTAYFTAIVRGKGEEVASEFLGKYADPQEPIVRQGPEGVSHVRQDFAIAFQSAVFDFLPRNLKESIVAVVGEVEEMIRTNQEAGEVIFWWHKRNSHGVKRQFWELLANQTLHSIHQTRITFTAMNMGREQFKDYLKRLFSSNTFVLETFRAGGAPAYVRTPQAEARFTPALAMVGQSYQQWIDSLTVN
jgi:hypothetical protein